MTRLANASAPDMRFDVTENLADISAANLANYDVLFLSNSTLRIRNLTSGGAAVANPATRMRIGAGMSERLTIARVGHRGDGLLRRVVSSAAPERRLAASRGSRPT